MRGREGESAEENGVDDARKDETLDAEETFVEEVREIRLLPLRGVKKRRDSSPTKRCVGDHAEIGTRPKVLRMLANHDESRILFTDSAFKINREGRPKERCLMVSGKAVYVMKPDTLKCGMRIDLRDVAAVTLSTLADNFCLVSVKGDGNDLLFTCSHKTEFATTVVQGAESLLGAAVPLVFSNTMTLRFASVYERTVVFEENEDHEAVHTKISEPRLRQGAKE